MKKIFSNPILLFILRLVLGFIFLYAGAVKIITPAVFIDAINNYQILGPFLTDLTAILLPWIEVFTGIMLISGIAVRETAFIISVLLVVFIISAIVSLARGLDIECGCFGSASVKVGMEKIIENLLLLMSGILLIISGSNLFSVRKD